MANPLPVLCPEGVWTQVAVNTNIGMIHQLSFAPERYLQTYRETGDSAPVNNNEGARLFGSGSLKTFIAHTTPIDIYVKAVGANGIIRTADTLSDPALKLDWPLIDGIVPAIADDYNATFARSTAGTYFPAATPATMVAANADEDRFESNGILIEPQRENLALYSQLFDHATWVKSNLTVTSSLISAPYEPSTMEVLTAATANATILQSSTSASADRVLSIFLLRKTGSGQVQFTVDGGATWTTVTVTGTITRLTITQATVTDPQFGIRIVTAGDEVYAWQSDLEIGKAATSSIFTTSSATTRTADDLRLPAADGVNFSQSEGVLFADVVTSLDEVDVSLHGGLISLRNASLFSILSQFNQGRFASTDGTNTATIDVDIAAGTLYKVFVRWSGSTLAIGADGTQKAPTSAYDGAFIIDTHYRIGYGTTERFWIKNIRVYEVDKGQVWCEKETA